MFAGKITAAAAASEGWDHFLLNVMEISEKDGCITIEVRVVPRASRSQIVRETDGVIKARIAAPPVDGAANAELVKLFAKLLGIARSGVEIVSGQASRTKRIRITGVTAEQFQNALHLSERKTA